MYAAQQAAECAQADSTGADANESDMGDDVVDAEFEEVKEDEKK